MTTSARINDYMQAPRFSSTTTSSLRTIFKYLIIPLSFLSALAFIVGLSLLQGMAKWSRPAVFTLLMMIFRTLGIFDFYYIICFPENATKNKATSIVILLLGTIFGILNAYLLISLVEKVPDFILVWVLLVEILLYMICTGISFCLLSEKTGIFAQNFYSRRFDYMPVRPLWMPEMLVQNQYTPEFSAMQYQPAFPEFANSTYVIPK